MRIAIFGAGGIDGYLGARLSQAGEKVVLIARGEHLQAVRDHGLRVDSIKGDFVATPALATGNSAEGGLVDVGIMGVKACQVIEAAQPMRPMIRPETISSSEWKSPNPCSRTCFPTTGLKTVANGRMSTGTGTILVISIWPKTGTQRGINRGASTGGTRRASLRRWGRFWRANQDSITTTD